MFRSNIFGNGSKPDPYSKYRIIEKMSYTGCTYFIPMKRFLFFFWCRLPEFGYSSVYPTCRNFNEAKHEIDRYIRNDTSYHKKKVHKVS